MEHSKVRARRPRGPKAGAHRWRVQEPDLAKVRGKARGSHELRLGRGQRAEP